jgi:signal transduction histidine kinase
MKILPPSSLFGRAVLVLVVGITLTHLLTMSYHYSDPHHRLSLFHGQQVADRIAGVADLMSGISLMRRADALANFSSPEIAAAIGVAPSLGDVADWRAEHLAEYLGHLVPRGSVAAGVIGERFCGLVPGIAAGVGGTCAESGETLVVRFDLDDGAPLVFAAPLSGVGWALVSRVGAEVLIMGLGTIVLAAWAARWLIRPLAAFGQAADRLGRDLRGAAIDEQGPSEIRHAARALNEMQARLSRFVEDRTQMLAAISHDLRTPITRLRLRAEFVEDAEQRAKVLSDLDDMERMTDSVLAFARDEAGGEDPQPVDLTALIESLCNDAEDAGTPVTCAGALSAPVSGRPVALKRGFANLIDNAAKYGGGVAIQLRENGGDVAVEIDDDGPGIPDEDMEQVFAPFFRLDRSRGAGKGSGLGLSVARSIFRAHGGDVALSNRPEGGLRATVTLPR